MLYSPSYACVWNLSLLPCPVSSNPLSLLILSLPLLSLLQNMLPESSAYLENTLQFHSSFKEAAVGLRTVKCVLVLKKHDMFDVATVAEGGVRWWLRMVLGTFQNAVHVHDMMHTNLFKLLYVYRLQHTYACLLPCCYGIQPEVDDISLSMIVRIFVKICLKYKSLRNSKPV